MNVKTVVLAGGPDELVSSIGSCIRSLPGCGVSHYETIIEAKHCLAPQAQAGLLLVYVEKRADQPAVLELLQEAKSRTPSVPMVVIAESEVDIDRRELLGAGATDCLTRPLNLSRLSFLIDFLTLRGRLVGSIANEEVAEWESAKKVAPPVQRQKIDEEGGSQLIFESERSKSLLKIVQRMAQVDSSVLLTGETGSGKTCLARMMHDLSPRRKKPFVVVNCGAIPESLLESELFGHGQGAFTGADRNYRGRFAQAEDGTLFLDEIDSLPLSSQSSLLRVVEDRAFEAVGSGKCQQLASRLIFATNRNLTDEVKAGRFRMDLYYRLNVVALAIPPLRDRISAIPQMVNQFLRSLRQRGMTAVERFSPEALDLMCGYHWPGNVRELKNVVERIAVLGENEVVQVHDLPEEIALGRPAFDLPDDKVYVAPRVLESSLTNARQEAERETIVTTLKRCRDNRTKAAEVLGISRTAFYKKLNQLGIA